MKPFLFTKTKKVQVTPYTRWKIMVPVTWEKKDVILVGFMERKYTVTVVNT